MKKLWINQLPAREGSKQTHSHSSPTLQATLSTSELWGQTSQHSSQVLNASCETKVVSVLGTSFLPSNFLVRLQIWSRLSLWSGLAQLIPSQGHLRVNSLLYTGWRLNCYLFSRVAVQVRGSGQHPGFWLPT